MLLLTTSDPTILPAMERAARPDEDVFRARERVREALRHGFPRLHVVVEPAPAHPASQRHVPTLYIPREEVDAWSRTGGRALDPRSCREARAWRLAELIRVHALGETWVDRLLGEMSRVAARPLPLAFRGFARPVLEFPRRYTDLGDLGASASLTPGAIKSRFRRRGLESPFVYLRWLRSLAVAQVLADTGVTVDTAAERLGFTTGANMCRAVRVLAGVTPGRAREPSERRALLVTFVSRYLTHADLDRWRSLGPLLPRRTAA